MRRPVVAWLTVPLDAFAVTAGNPVAYRSSAKAFRHFCGGCGTPLTWREADNPRLVDISIASLDNPEAVAPTMHVWTGSQHRLGSKGRPPAAVSDKRTAQDGSMIGPAGSGRLAPALSEMTAAAARRGAVSRVLISIVRFVPKRLSTGAGD